MFQTVSVFHENVCIATVGSLTDTFLYMVITVSLISLISLKQLRTKCTYELET